MICVKPGPGVRRLPLDARGFLGRGCRCPGFNSLLAGLQGRIKRQPHGSGP
jgi:hypothetical protein